MTSNYFKVLTTLLVIAFAANSCQKETNEAYQAPLLVPSSNLIQDHYIVMVKPDLMKDYSFSQKPSNREQAGLIAQEKRAAFQSEVTKLLANLSIPANLVSDYYTEVFYGFAIQLDKTQLKRLLSHPMTEMIENDMVVKLPDFTVEKSGITPRSQTIPCGISLANGPADGSSSSKWIWIVDTGIDLDHPDLNVQTSSPYAKSFVGGTPDDCNGHGTHCAGIAAAKDNTIGSVGVSSGAMVVPVRVLNCQGSGQTSKIISGLDHVATYDEPGDVVNMSLGGYWGANCSTNSSFKTALTNIGNSGTFVAVAAGNSSDNADLYTPACINGSNINTVAAMDCNKVWAYYSNYGKPPVDWIATGSSVYSTYKNGGYATLSGTSMASPHVAGIMHSRQSAPNSTENVTYNSVSYPIAKR